MSAQPGSPSNRSSPCLAAARGRCGPGSRRPPGGAAIRSTRPPRELLDDRREPGDGRLPEPRLRALDLRLPDHRRRAEPQRPGLLPRRAQPRPLRPGGRSRQLRRREDGRHAAGRDDREPLPGGRPRGLQRSPAGPRERRLGPGRGLPRGLQDRLDRSRNAAPGRPPADRRPVRRKALRKPLRLADRRLRDGPRTGAGDLRLPAARGQPGLQGPAPTHRRRHAAAALLPLPPALPRRRPGAADQPAGLRHVRHQGDALPVVGRPPVESTSTFQIVSGPKTAAAPPGSAPFAPASKRARGTTRPAPTRPSTCA